MSEWDGKERRVECIKHNKKTDELYAKLNAHMEEGARARVKVDQIHKIIIGNGDPTQGLIFKEALNTQFRKNVTSRLDKLVWLIVAIGLTSIIPQVVGFTAKAMVNG